MIKLAYYLFLIIFSSFAFATVYQCKDDNGNVLFSDKPCEDETSQTEINATSTKFSRSILTKTPSSVASVKEAIKYIGRNQLVTINLDALEQNYVLPGKSYQITQSFIRVDKYSRTMPMHNMRVHLINGNGVIEYKAKILSHELSKSRSTTFFNARFSDVNNRMVAMGLDDKSRKGVSSGYARWRWQYRGFSCYSKADFGHANSVLSVTATCETKNY